MTRTESIAQNGGWPPNQDQSGASMYRRHGYDTGKIKDGHTLTRFDEDGTVYIEVEHPECCAERDTTYGVPMISHNCPWGRFAAEAGPLEEQHQDGTEAALRDLPLEVPVTPTWEMKTWQSWTDYGWEGDGYFSWWVDRA